MVDRDHHARQLFEQAAKQRPEERARFLRTACGDDAELYESVVALLRADDHVPGVVRLGSPSGRISEPVLEPSTVVLPSRDAFSPGQTLGDRYRMTRRLGRGGMGEVWQAYDLKLRVDVALKSLRRDRFPEVSAFEILRREVRAARQVISPNVCRIFDLEESNGDELVSMEYIDGTTLYEVVRERGPLAFHDAMEIAAQLLAGLEAIHGAGLVHRDVKLENIMITRSGRVVLMDFGLAKPTAEGGTMAGTLGYMAPEQLSGGRVDARADIFAAGVVLTEMITADAVKDSDSRETLQHRIHEEPPSLPDGLWKPILRRAVAKEPANRYPSALELSRALEDVTFRVEGAEDLRPYPGLASFTEEDTAYFFGREVEVEAVWKKLPGTHLLGLIGPSGAGKSSFLQAGLLPARPSGWRHVICHPGDVPLRSLGRALVPELSEDAEAMQQMVAFDDPDVAVSLFSRWRNRCEEALLIVDQFEELFTLNGPTVQAQVAELIARLALEADVHVVISMRDDFLMYCHDHDVLTPIFSELTPLKPPQGAALRRALVQPALLCGFRFEDERLADEMLDEVSNERGALPLLAFAMETLWKRRDRERGLLTRSAHNDMGGVGGALAQHAEATLERIGMSRLALVRELFRNLVTAQGTRAAREVEELLSVFPEGDRPAAREVLGQLIDARLLTSFEIEGGDDEEVEPGRRVEIIHESLITAWPRLVRWRTQDEDSAQFRDQLRQGAHLWSERGRSPELLWSGSAFREFQVWRDRYPHGLSSTEEAFAQAMTRRAVQRRRRRRLAVTTVIVVLCAVLGVVGGLWRLSAERAQRAEAHQLVALGKNELELSPTTTVAYAIASLERRDSPEARHLALEALWRGPTFFAVPERVGYNLEFSRRWLVVQEFGKPGFTLLHRDGRISRIEPDKEGWNLGFWFDRRSDFLMSLHRVPYEQRYFLRVWSIPDGSVKFDRPSPDVVPQVVQTGSGALITSTKGSPGDGPRLIQSWPLDGGDPMELANLGEGVGNPLVDPTASWVAYAKGTDVFVRPLDGQGAAHARCLGSHPDTVRDWSIPILIPDTGRLVTRDRSGEIRIWSTDPESTALVHSFRSPERSTTLAATESSVAWQIYGAIHLRSLAGPADAEPTMLVGMSGAVPLLQFHPSGQWLAAGCNDPGIRGVGGTYSLWPLGRSYPHIFRGHTGAVGSVTFSPDGRWLVSCGVDGTVRRWALTGGTHKEERIILRQAGSIGKLAMDPAGRYVVAASAEPPHVQLIPLVDDGPEGELVGFRHSQSAVAVSPDGQRVAMGGGANGQAPEDMLVRVYDLDSGDIQILDAADRKMIRYLGFTPDGELLASDSNGLRLWNLEDGTFRALIPKPVRRFDLSADGRILSAVLTGDEVGPRTHLYEFVEQGLRELASPRSGAGVLDPSGTYVITGVAGGLGVSRLTHEEGHLLLGHEGNVKEVAFSPDGRWIASAGEDGTVRLWTMPEGEPFHTLPYEEFKDRLCALTNVRVVPDEDAPSGYRLDLDPFPGWETLPTW